LDLHELLELLGIEEPEEFEYYENFADLVESDEEVSVSVLMELFSHTDATVVSDIIGQYFDDMLETLPHDVLDMHILIENIKLSLMGLLKAGDAEKNMADFAEEVGKFKTWYSFESAVECISTETGEGKVLSLRDALTLVRLEKLGEEEFSYDFTDCLDYEMEDYIMSFADLARADAEEDEENLLQNGYVLDDETEDGSF
jgi:hypothetical protein